jgi:hypothetical protein
MPPTGLDLLAHSYDLKGNPLPPAAPNFRRLGVVRPGEIGDLHTLMLRFSETVKLTAIDSTRDFRIEQGSSCVEGNLYAARSTCTLLVRFTPQGAGQRLGRITIRHTGPGSPMPLTLGGFSPAAVISFTPAQITTVKGTYPSSVGLLSQAQNLGIDGSDTLYIADTGNKQIRKLDSSGVINSIATNLSASPWGVTADPAGVVWFTEPGANAIFNINPDGVVAKATGTGTDPCAQGDSCLLSNESVINPRSITIGVNGGNAGLAEQTKGAAQIQFWTSPPQLVRVSNPYTYATSTPGAFTFDPNGATFYASWITPTHCQIESGVQSGNPGATKIAGGSTCGFSGDGGKAGNAQLNKSVGQIAFDLAGNLYFTDTLNQRVRRIDEASNVIRTVAGSGNSGYSGDGGSALESTLSNPTGLAIDSQGAIYVISGDGHGLGKQVVRKIGPQGFLNFGSQVRNTAGAARLLTVSNTGTIGIDSGPAPMILTKAVITGANAADFTIDPNTSSCNLQTGSVLPAGNSCRIGVIFKPSATGTRTANLVLLDNTINGADTALLSG